MNDNGYQFGKEEVQQQAVEVGHAHYDPKTKEFKWNTTKDSK